MKKKLILLSSVVLILAVIFTVIFPQRQDDDTLMELLDWDGGAGRGFRVYYFVVTNDGTFISYRGISRFSRWQDRTLHLLRWRGREREQITLREEDFLYISELVDKIVLCNFDGGVLSDVFTTFIHNGNIYTRGTMSDPLLELRAFLLRLTPLRRGAWY